jgi:hypothetical protein
VPPNMAYQTFRQFSHGNMVQPEHPKKSDPPPNALQ